MVEKLPKTRRVALLGDSMVAVLSVDEGDHADRSARAANE